MLVNLVDYLLNLRNDEILTQHSTSHVPNQAIPMNTFLQRPRDSFEQNFNFIACVFLVLSYQY